MGDKSVINPVRFALSNLLATASRMVDDDNFELFPFSKLTLELETERWDQCFVLTIERMPDDN